MSRADKLKNREKLMTDMACSFSRMAGGKELDKLSAVDRNYMLLLASQWMDNILANADKLNVGVESDYRL